MLKGLVSGINRAVGFVKSKIKAFTVAVMGALGVQAIATPAHAVGTLTVPAIDLTDFYAAAVVLLGALAAMWIAHKVIGFFKSK
jgi:hypothetical protein